MNQTPTASCPVCSLSLELNVQPCPQCGWDFPVMLGAEDEVQGYFQQKLADARAAWQARRYNPQLIPELERDPFETWDEFAERIIARPWYVGQAILLKDGYEIETSYFPLRIEKKVAWADTYLENLIELHIRIPRDQAKSLYKQSSTWPAYLWLKTENQLLSRGELILCLPNGEEAIHTEILNKNFLDHAPQTRLAAGDFIGYFRLLTNFEFLTAKLEHCGLSALLSDYVIAHETPDTDRERMFEKVRVLQLIHGAIRLSALTLNHDKTQLASQLWGRMRGLEIPDLQPLLQQAEDYDGSWLQLLAGTLHPPGGEILCIFRDHTMAINSVTFGRGETLVSAAWNVKSVFHNQECVFAPEVIHWDCSTGQAASVIRLTGHTDCINDIAFSRDCTRAVTVSDDGALIVWDLGKGGAVQTLNGHPDKFVSAVALSADGSRAITGSDEQSHDRFVVWDLCNGEILKVMQGHDRQPPKFEGMTSLLNRFNNIQILEISADGHFAWTEYEDHVFLWDLEKGEAINSIDIHDAEVFDLAISNDGTKALLYYWDTDSREFNMALWDIAIAQNAHPIRTLQGGAGPLAFSADGIHGLSCSTKECCDELILWDLEKGQTLKTLRGHEDTINTVALNSDNTRALSGDDDGNVFLWDLTKNCNNTQRYAHEACLHDIAVSPDGSRALSGAEDGTVLLWNLAAGEVIKTLVPHEGLYPTLTTLAMSSDARWAVLNAEDNSLILLDLLTGKVLRTLRENVGHISAIALSANGNLALSGFRSPHVTVGLSRYLASISQPKNSDFTENNTTECASTLVLWDLINGQAAMSFGSESVTSVALNADGTLGLSGSESGSIKLWDMRTGEAVRTLDAHAKAITGVALSGCSTRAISSSYDKALILWDLAAGRAIKTLLGHEKAVMDVAMNADGTRALSCSWDHTAILWDLYTGQPIARFFADAGLTTCGLSADGQMMVAGDTIGNVYILRYRCGRTDLQRNS